MYLIRVGVQLKRLPDNSLDMDTSCLKLCIHMKLVFISCHYQSLLVALNIRQAKEFSLGAIFNRPKAIHGSSAPSPTRVRDIKVVEKARTKEAKESFRNFFLEGTTPTWTCMDVGYASFIKSIDVQKPQRVLSVPKVGTYVVARAVLPPCGEEPRQKGVTPGPHQRIGKCWCGYIRLHGN